MYFVQLVDWTKADVSIYYSHWHWLIKYV